MLPNEKYELEEGDDDNNEPEGEVGQAKKVGEEDDIAEEDGKEEEGNGLDGREKKVLKQT